MILILIFFPDAVVGPFAAGLPRGLFFISKLGCFPDNCGVSGAEDDNLISVFSVVTQGLWIVVRSLGYSSGSFSISDGTPTGAMEASYSSPSSPNHCFESRDPNGLAGSSF